MWAICFQHINATFEAWSIFSYCYAYDPNKRSLAKFCRAYSALPVDLSSLDLSFNRSPPCLYCSDHSSHFSYAKTFLEAYFFDYCEKPLTISLDQLYILFLLFLVLLRFCHYNRPHSRLYTDITRRISFLIFH